MPRANRYFLPGQVWHLTHRCHEREFLLKFRRDRLAWLSWLHEAKQRFGLCILNYIVTSNHVHLLVWDRGDNAISRSMQLIAGRTAQAYNQRKHRRGAYWEDRYHATAVQGGEHLTRCLAYIDLNMVRAGRVTHPDAWEESGFHELAHPRKRYGLVNHAALMELLAISDEARLKQTRLQAAETLMQIQKGRERDGIWTESLAVGDRTFVERIQNELGLRAKYRTVTSGDGRFLLKDPPASYRAHLGPENRPLSPNSLVIRL